MKFLIEVIPLLVWAALWMSGGWMLTGALFHLRRGEGAMIGLALGLILETWLANLLAHALSILPAIWASGALICLAGAAAMAALKRGVKISIGWPQWVLFGGLVLVFTLIGRGLAIFDDYQNLPTISLMATGDVPPRFALNPALNFGYHYFLLLFAAQLMRLGDIFPWTALDVTRGIVMALPLMLAGLWAYRLTRSQLAACLAGAVLAFAGGSRWLLLFLPQAWLNGISNNIKLIGSAATSAPSLAEALMTNWKIDGAGPIPFPFAFYTGINQPFVMAYTGISGAGILILLVLLLIANRHRHWAAFLVVAALLAALALANEIAFLLLIFGFVLVVGTWMVRNRSWRLLRELTAWIATLFASTCLAALQGGLLTEMIRTRLSGGGREASYFDTSLRFVWPPAFVSAHLGSLSLTNPAQLIAALAEIGPIILVTPLIWSWCRKSFRLGNWYEASLIAASFGTVIALFIAFEGPLFTATPRLMSGWFFACSLYAVPLVWQWAGRRSHRLQAILAAGLGAACLSGLVLFSIQLLAMQRPVLATFITPMDAKMSQEYWNKLEPKALVFDHVVFHSANGIWAIHGVLPELVPARDAGWQALDAAPDPQKIRAAGFDYVYFDKGYWDGLGPAQQALFEAACVRQVAQVDGIHSEQDYTKDFRRLLDVRGCK